MEQSLLPAPVQFTKLVLAPGERADLIIDFGGLPLGTLVTVKNDALVIAHKCSRPASSRAVRGDADGERQRCE